MECFYGMPTRNAYMECLCEVLVWNAQDGMLAWIAHTKTYMKCLIIVSDPDESQSIILCPHSVAVCQQHDAHYCQSSHISCALLLHTVTQSVRSLLICPHAVYSDTPHTAVSPLKSHVPSCCEHPHALCLYLYTWSYTVQVCMSSYPARAQTL